ncbi:ATP-binding protein [Agrococcus carbonis]|uniref:Molybdopterin-guanine dinucleotide biosynthesis protein n=1 Tax=Agrococcus carbonis TaxID=684552 RepID=A0A1H1KTB3_9MICO|nr:AAA family ATPase [Agrococcus carbonis]SDR65588.1 Molybdopterin-guanine dinucleotide biosynthesis protein [Agrococcus carbonis]
MHDNPFRPGFGISPPMLAGRDALLDEWREVFALGAWSPYRAALVTGMRGVGKTVLLNAVEDEARARGWTVLHGTLHAGLVDTLERDRLPALLQETDPEAFTREVTGLTVSQVGGVTTAVAQRYEREPRLESMLTRLVELAEARGAGVLVSLDEVAKESLEALRRIAIAVQHLLREDRRIAVVAAGVPASIAAALDADGLTFFRRAQQVRLDTLTLAESRAAIAEPVRSRGRSIGEAALEQAARASRGYPYLVQSIGARAWEHAPEAHEITTDAVRHAVEVAFAAMGESVIVPALRGLSARDRDYLIAMAEDDGPASTTAVAERMGVSAGNAGKQRLRLLDGGIVLAPERGLVDFAIPLMREHLRAHPHDGQLGLPTAARETFRD